MRELFLREIRIPEDTDFLYKAMTEKESWLYLSSVYFKNRDDFEKWLIAKLQDSFHDFYMIMSPNAKEPLGYIHNFEFSLIDGHCKIMIYMAKKHRRSGLCIYPSMLFFKEMFERYPLRKLYFTIVSENHSSKDPCRSAGLGYEGSIKDFRSHNGKFYDLEFYSMSRSRYYELERKLKI